VAEACDVEFVANNPGDWMIHCHLPHHMMNQMSSMVGPMTRTRGMSGGMGMEEGMGMARRSALAEENGPSLGRGMGVGSTYETATTNGATSQSMTGMRMGEADVSKDANSVPGFPQDAFMEGPAMAMDKMVEKPENYGLRPGWSGFMQGMMTFVRVLAPEQYDKIISMREQHSDKPETMPDMQHPNGG
jgi:hypothetical protein